MRDKSNTIGMNDYDRKMGIDRSEKEKKKQGEEGCLYNSSPKNSLSGKEGSTRTAGTLLVAST